jgi:hypothetical protein
MDRVCDRLTTSVVLMIVTSSFLIMSTTSDPLVTLLRANFQPEFSIRRAVPGCNDVEATDRLRATPAAACRHPHTDEPFRQSALAGAHLGFGVLKVYRPDLQSTYLRAEIGNARTWRTGTPPLSL